jgi:hypothetical protein
MHKYSKFTFNTSTKSKKCHFFTIDHGIKDLKSKKKIKKKVFCGFCTGPNSFFWTLKKNFENISGAALDTWLVPS